MEGGVRFQYDTVKFTLGGGGGANPSAPQIPALSQFQLLAKQIANKNIESIISSSNQLPGSTIVNTLTVGMKSSLLCAALTITSLQTQSHKLYQYHAMTGTRQEA